MAADPYRYFRVEARELIEGLSQGILELERGTDAAVLARLFRFAHTLKGAARVVRQLELAELAHQVEELLARSRDVARGPTAGELRELLDLVDRMGARLADLEPAPDPASIAAPVAPAAPTPAGGSAPRASVEEAFQTVRIEIEEMDAVLRAVTETGVYLAALKREVARLRELGGLSSALTSRVAPGAGSGSNPSSTHGIATDLQAGIERVSQALDAGLERVEQELSDVREGTDRLRLVPIQTLFPPLERAVRDAAQTLGKRARFETVAGALRLDAHVLGPLRDALLHLVRNAVAHGIESPSERAAAGKAIVGEVRLVVERRGHRVGFSCHDDGKGIDIAAVRRELLQRDPDRHAEIAAMGQRDLLARLLTGRFSTATSVTQIAGRGVGLDVVREVATHLQGEVEIRSEPGRGTSVELDVPVSLAALRALVVEVGGTAAAIPLEAVRETLRVGAGGIARSPRGDSLAHGGKVIPFLPLGRALRQKGAVTPRHSACSAVVLSVGEHTAAIGVDRLVGAFDVIVRPLPNAAAADAVVAGASLDHEGNPRLVLDAAGLLAACERLRGDGADGEPEARLPILVIDDSLTTRMLEQSILESAGYEVELAVSAEQGLEKARLRRYGLFIVDVEMPGMDGFEFLRRTRADPEHGGVPAILVTSLGAAEHRQRGLDAGASAFIVKDEFDQNLLLDRIRSLLG